jgi:UDP-N-acetylmuramate dehydrogenase
VTAVLADHTTLRVGGAASAWFVASTDDELVGEVRRCDQSGVPVLLVGGGSNLLVSDAGFPGAVIEVATTGVAATDLGDSVRVELAAGESWDDIVSRSVARGWTGIEALSGIPGRVGATPVQNVGAYGQDVSQVIASVRVLDRSSGEVRELDREGCGFGYRTSLFKREAGRWVVLSVSMVLGTSGRGVVRYRELAESLGVAVGDEVDVAAIRGATLALRARKGMVLDPGDHDTWSAGSFFTNPVVSPDVAAGIPPECPRYPAEDGVKLSAAWLIEHAGMTKGFALSESAPAAISHKHTLALTNRGGATAADLVDLARTIRDRVRDRFAIDLRPEPVLVGLTL